MEKVTLAHENDYQNALRNLEKVFDAEPGTQKGTQAQLLVSLIEEYEKKHFPIASADPKNPI